MTAAQYEQDHPLVETLQREAGEALRSVTVYDESSYDLLYLRENVDAIYSTDELDEIFEDLRLQGWGRERVESLFHAGSLECSIYCFEEAMTFHFAGGEFVGAFVTYDRGAELDVETFVDVCNSRL